MVNRLDRGAFAPPCSLRQRQLHSAQALGYQERIEQTGGGEVRISIRGEGVDLCTCVRITCPSLDRLSRFGVISPC